MELQLQLLVKSNPASCLLIVCDRYFDSRKHHKIKNQDNASNWLGVFIVADNQFKKLLQNYKHITKISFEYVELDKRYILENVFQIEILHIHGFRPNELLLVCNFTLPLPLVKKCSKIKNVSPVHVQEGQVKPLSTTILLRHGLITLGRMSMTTNRLLWQDVHYLPLKFYNIKKEIMQRLQKMRRKLSLPQSPNATVSSVQESNDLQTDTMYMTTCSKESEKEISDDPSRLAFHVDISESFKDIYSYRSLFNHLDCFLRNTLLQKLTKSPKDYLGITYKRPLHSHLINFWKRNTGTALDSREQMTEVPYVNKYNYKESNNDHKDESNHTLQFRKVLGEPEKQDDQSYKRETEKQDDLKWIYKYNWSEKLHYISFLTLQVYPVFNLNTRPTLHNLMRYELFRVCSFAYSNPPGPENVQVTQLAQSGFYNLDGSGRVCCFFCGHECDLTNEESVEIAYRHHCRQQEQNIPLNEWTHGLNPVYQQPYFSLFGDRTPTLFALPDSEFEEGDDNQLEQITGATGFSEGVNASDTRQTSSYSNSQGVNDSVEGSVNPTHHSLPTNLNTVSGSIVIQESEESQSRQVLTSKSLEPVNFSHTPTLAANVADTATTQAAEQSGGDAPVEGAVGGQTTFDLGLASYPQFASSASRRATFTGWNSEHPQLPDDLVAGGFFYAGYADCVRCFNCGLGLKYWRPTDIPAYQHARFRPNCVYNKMYKGQEYIDKVQQDLREEQAAALAQANATNQDNQVATPYTLTEASQPTQPPQPPAVPNVTPPSDIDNHEYLRLPASQEALAAGWSREQIVQAVTNVVEEMGVVAQNVQLDILMDVLRELYSADQPQPLTGMNNRNEEIISSSSVAEPSIASIRRPPPETTFSDSSKLAEYQLREDSFEHADGGPAAPEVPDSAATVGNPQEQYLAVERENAYLNQRTICGICHERPVSSIYLPCGHVLACQACAENESYCRACNRPIVATSNIYLS